MVNLTELRIKTFSNKFAFARNRGAYLIALRKARQNRQISEREFKIRTGEVDRFARGENIESLRRPEARAVLTVEEQRRAQLEQRRAAEPQPGPAGEELLFTPAPAADIAAAREGRFAVDPGGPRLITERLFTPAPAADIAAAREGRFAVEPGRELLFTPTPRADIEAAREGRLAVDPGGSRLITERLFTPLPREPTGGAVLRTLEVKPKFGTTEFIITTEREPKIIQQDRQVLNIFGKQLDVTKVVESPTGKRVLEAGKFLTTPIKSPFVDIAVETTIEAQRELLGFAGKPGEFLGDIGGAFSLEAFKTIKTPSTFLTAGLFVGLGATATGAKVLGSQAFQIGAPALITAGIGLEVAAAESKVETLGAGLGRVAGFIGVAKGLEVLGTLPSQIKPSLLKLKKEIVFGKSKAKFKLFGSDKAFKKAQQESVLKQLDKIYDKEAEIFQVNIEIESGKPVLEVLKVRPDDKILAVRKVFDKKGALRGGRSALQLILEPPKTKVGFRPRPLRARFRPLSRTFRPRLKTDVAPVVSERLSLAFLPAIDIETIKGVSTALAPATAVSLKPFGKRISIQDIRKEQFSRIAQVPITAPSQIPVPTSLTIPRTTPSQIPVPISLTIPRLRPPRKITKRKPPITPIIPKIDLPRIPKGKPRKKELLQRTMAQQRKVFTPSLTAEIFDIKAKGFKTQKFFTGLEFRPKI